MTAAPRPSPAHAPKTRRAAARELIAAPGHDFWVFGYGSLMWRPNFAYAERRPARIWGYHRAPCIYSVEYRGTYQRPGLVLGLDRGGSCRGMAFRVHAARGPEVMGYLYEREMVTRVYRPRWLRGELAAGGGEPARRETLYTFVADPGHDQYTGRLDDAAAVRLIRQGCGKAGDCLEYLENTLCHLRELGIEDRALARVIAKAAAP